MHNYIAYEQTIFAVFGVTVVLTTGGVARGVHMGLFALNLCTCAPMASYACVLLLLTYMYSLYITACMFHYMHLSQLVTLYYVL